MFIFVVINPYTVVCILFCYQVKSQLLGIKGLFKHQYLQILGFKLLQILPIFTHLKLWVAVARHTFEWVIFFNSAL